MSPFHVGISNSKPSRNHDLSLCRWLYGQCEEPSLVTLVVTGVRMVHMLTLEMSIIQWSPALPSCAFASSCLCLLTKHVMHVHVPPSPCLAPPPININVTTTLPLLPPSPIDLSSPLVSPAFPLKFRHRTQSAPSKPFSVAQDPCRLKLQTLAALDNCQRSCFT